MNEKADTLQVKSFPEASGASSVPEGIKTGKRKTVVDEMTSAMLNPTSSCCPFSCHLCLAIATIVQEATIDRAEPTHPIITKTQADDKRSGQANDA